MMPNDKTSLFDDVLSLYTVQGVNCAHFLLLYELSIILCTCMLIWCCIVIISYL